MTEVKSSLDGIKNIVNQSEGYKNGLKDGFKVLHWFTGIIFAIGGGAIAFLIQYVLKNMN